MIRPEAADPRAFPRRGAFVAALLVALPLIVEVVIAWRVLGPLEHTLFPDDAFYYLCVGRNLADGLGPTFDGVHPTSGFHPLWQAIVALVALAFDNETLTPAVAVTNLACLVAAVAIVAVAFRRRGLSPGMWTLTVLVAFANPYLLKTSLNGMESGLVWLFWSLALLVLTRLLEGRTGVFDAASAGVIAGAVLLTRLDGIWLVGALAWVTATTSDRRRFRGIAAFSTAACAAAGPYFAWMWIRFGHWLPVSVLVKAGGAETSALTIAILGVLFAAGVVLVTRQTRFACARVGGLRTAPAGAAALLVLAGLLPLAIYGVVNRGRLTHLWYYPGVLTGGLVLTALAASALVEAGRRRLFIVGAVVGLALAACAWTLRLAVHRSEEHYRVADAMGRQLQRTLPADVRVAGWNIGLVAYRRSCRVTNLDGLVNSYAYLDALREHRVAAWLDREGISGLVEYFDGDPLAGLGERDPALPGRVSERFRMEFEYVGPLALSATPRRRVFVYFDYRPASPPRYN